jgi:hypothetical protein
VKTSKYKGAGCRIKGADRCNISLIEIEVAFLLITWPLLILVASAGMNMELTFSTRI